MSRFSEHLEQCIMDSGMTENQLAKVSGFNRSYIALMKNGQRVSPDTGKMTRLLDALTLSPFEYDKLWSEYIQARMGDDRYSVIEAIVRLIESFGTISNISVKSHYHHEIPEVKAIDNEMDVKYMIKIVIEEEARKPKGHIHLIMQPDTSGIINWLPSVCKGNPEMKIKHIVCLERFREGQEKGQIYNINVLQKLIPMMVSSTGCNYEAFYYYDQISSHFNTSALMPLVVITSDYVINIVSDYGHAMVSKEPEIVELYEQLFQNHRRKCKSMFQRFEDQMDVFEYYDSNEHWEDKQYVLASQPCFGVLKTDTLVRKYSEIGNGKMMGMLENILQKHHEQFKSAGSKIVSYCTKEGLKRFVEQGIIDELPKEIYRNLELSDRLDMLRMLVQMVKQGKYDIYLLDEHELEFPKELFISTFGVSEVCIMYLPDSEQQRFILNEKRTAKLLMEFLEEFMQLPFVCSKEKTLVFLEELIRTYSTEK